MSFLGGLFGDSSSSSESATKNQDNRTAFEEGQSVAGAEGATAQTYGASAYAIDFGDKSKPREVAIAFNSLDEGVIKQVLESTGSTIDKVLAASAVSTANIGDAARLAVDTARAVNTPADDKVRRDFAVLVAIALGGAVLLFRVRK